MKHFTSQEINMFIPSPMFDEKIISEKDISYPRISIVTPSYNQRKFLDRTILSVLNQNYPNLEYIIIDGGSTDGSVDIIKKYQNHLAYWTSEKDNGIYDAMNKGIALSTGDIIHFLNCGDLFYNNKVLERVSKKFKEDRKIGIVYGLTECYSDDTGIKYVTGGRINYSKVWQGMPICHQSMFFKKDLFNVLGKYETRFRIVADYEFLLRFIKKDNEHGYKEIFINSPISKFKLYGFNSKNYISTLKEMRQVSKMYFGTTFCRNVYFSLVSVKFFLLILATKARVIRYHRRLKYNYFKKIGLWKNYYF